MPRAIRALLPALLRASAEQARTALDSLGLIHSADDWPAMRLAHNRLAREHSGRWDAAPPALKRARGLVDALRAAHHAIRGYTRARFAV